MTAIQVKCPHCGEIVEAEQVGVVACPACLFEMEVEPEPQRQIPAEPIWDRPRRKLGIGMGDLLSMAAVVLVAGAAGVFAILLAVQAGEEGLVMLKLILAIVVGVPLYFAPSVIAWKRGTLNATAITVLNIFLGWTFIGWVVALVWALHRDRQVK